jgi:hypothetical protein
MGFLMKSIGILRKPLLRSKISSWPLKPDTPISESGHRIYDFKSRSQTLGTLVCETRFHTSILNLMSLISGLGSTTPARPPRALDSGHPGPRTRASDP